MDITTDVTGAGWVTPSLAKGRYCWVRVDVGPAAGVPAGTAFPLLLTATSVGDAAKQDAVKAETTCALTRRPDAVIHNGSTYLGDGAYNTSGTGQTHSRTVSSGTAATYLIRLYNDGNAVDGLVVNAQGDSALWGVKYFDHSTGADITAGVAGAGWVTSSLRSGAYASVRAEVTPSVRVAANAKLARLVTATSVGDGKTKDAVKTETTCAPSYQPDGTICNGSTYTGDNTYNTTGSDQSYEQTVAPGATATYHARFYNDGNLAQSLRITGTPGNSKWTVKYLDYSTGADITAAVTGAGWTTASLSPGGAWRVKVLVTPGASVGPGGVLPWLLTGTSTVDATKKDAVKATTTRE